MSYKSLTVAEIVAQPECVSALEDIRKVVVWTREINKLLVLINEAEKSIEEKLHARK